MEGFTLGRIGTRRGKRIFGRKRRDPHVKEVSPGEREGLRVKEGTKGKERGTGCGGEKVPKGDRGDPRGRRGTKKKEGRLKGRGDPRKGKRG